MSGMTAHTHKITTYTIDSHPNKGAVFDWVRSHWHDLYAWHDENAESLKGICDAFGLDIRGYAVDYSGFNSHCRITAKEWNVPFGADEMEGIRLWKYLQNHGYFEYLKKDCPFTGYYLDDDLLWPIEEFHENPEPGTTMQDIANDIGHQWVSRYIEDWEHTYSDSGLEDFLMANEYEFTEEGDFYQ
jgi:hypothetical protein